MTRERRAFLAAALVAFLPGRAHAHDGPPFPIVSQQAAGPYEISVWTDPDATDDGSAGGQFWVMLALADGSDPPPGTRAAVTLAPLDRTGPPRSGPASPIEGRTARQFVALLMDHEGRFAVRVDVSGPRGPAVVHAEVEATYDLRPPPLMLVVYLMPFVAVGLLWLKLFRHRRGRQR